MKDTFAGMRGTIIGWFAWFGVCVGILSAIKALKDILQVGLDGFFLKMIQYYQELLAPLVDVLKLLHFNINEFTLNLILLYIVLFMMSLRAGFFPLLRPKIFNIIKTREASWYQETLPRMPEQFPENMASGQKTKSGKWLMTCYKYKPDWLVFSKHFVGSIFLVPLITMAPFRNLFSRDLGGHGILRVAWKMRSEDREKGFIECEYKDRKTMLNSRYVWFLHAYIWVAIQTITLPVAVVLFFVFAEYK